MIEDGATRRGSSAGLSSAEAAARLARDGLNALPQRPSMPLWRRVGAQLRDPLIVVLLAAAALTLATGDWTDMAVIVLVIGVNTTVGVSQEIRADRAINALSELTAPSARVLRDGNQYQIPAAEVVVGDLLVLTEGDIIPADATVVETASMLVDESAVTGESLPVGKTAAVRAGDSAAEDTSVSAGTVLVKGRGQAIVTATGAASTTGRIATMLADGSGLTPLQRHLIGIGRLLAGVAVALCAIILAGGLIRGQPTELMVVTAISLVVAVVPESLPAVVTLGLALGARRMAARNALIRRLPAVETLGSVIALTTDKTGTLTEGRMVARRAWTPAAEAVITGSGYAPRGAIRVGDEELDESDPYGVTDMVTAVALCNDARLAPPATAGGEWAALGDPTEAALLIAAAKLGIDHGELRARFPRCDERPFDSDRKRMTTVHRLSGGGFRVVCKGAPEAILTPAVLADDPDLLARATDRAGHLAQAAFRVLAVAQTERPTPPEPDEDLEHGLRLLGLIAILDPPRTAAAALAANPPNPTPWTGHPGHPPRASWAPAFGSASSASLSSSPPSRSERPYGHITPAAPGRAWPSSPSASFSSGSPSAPDPGQVLGPTRCSWSRSPPPWHCNWPDCTYRPCVSCLAPGRLPAPTWRSRWPCRSSAMSPYASTAASISDGPHHPPPRVPRRHSTDRRPLTHARADVQPQFV
jgi:Ca2+-transporting ATPase